MPGYSLARVVWESVALAGWEAGSPSALLRGECCAMLRSFSCVWLFATAWTVACQAPLSVGIL